MGLARLGPRATNKNYPWKENPSSNEVRTLSSRITESTVQPQGGQRDQEEDSLCTDKEWGIVEKSRPVYDRARSG